MPTSPFSDELPAASPNPGDPVPTEGPTGKRAGDAQGAQGDQSVQAGTLYVVGTPIGNLEDMTFRALRILKAVDWVAAEDTRHTGKLLHHFQIKTPQVSYHEHNRATRTPELVTRLQGGASIALVSDAGMPGISDPGYELVLACWEAGLVVVPIPGVSAVVTAVCGAGLPSDRFSFEGFLPAKMKARREALAQVQQDPRTLVFYESPHRLRDTLGDMAAVLGTERPITVARELTKLHEQFWRGTVAGAIAYYQTRDPQGEFTLVVGGYVPPVQVLSEAELLVELAGLMEQGLPRSEACRQLAQRTQLSKRYLYQLGLAVGSDLS